MTKHDEDLSIEMGERIADELAEMLRRHIRAYSPRFHGPGGVPTIPVAAVLLDSLLKVATAGGLSEVQLVEMVRAEFADYQRAQAEFSGLLDEARFKTSGPRGKA